MATSAVARSVCPWLLDGLLGIHCRALRSTIVTCNLRISEPIKARPIADVPFDPLQLERLGIRPIHVAMRFLFQLNTNVLLETRFSQLHPDGSVDAFWSTERATFPGVTERVKEGPSLHSSVPSPPSVTAPVSSIYSGADDGLARARPCPSASVSYPERTYFYATAPTSAGSPLPRSWFLVNVEWTATKTTFAMWIVVKWIAMPPMFKGTYYCLRRSLPQAYKPLFFSLCNAMYAKRQLYHPTILVSSMNWRKAEGIFHSSIPYLLRSSDTADAIW